MLSNEVFSNSGFWDKSAVNNHFPEGRMEPLERLCNYVYADDVLGIMSLIDVEAWAQFAAFITISQTTHFDWTHNWRLYFDPATGKVIVHSRLIPQ